MIKLIITDMDCTLLDEYGKIPEGTFEIIRELKKRGIAFCAASGRGFKSLSASFEDLVDEMYFITDNGTNVYRGRELLVSHPMKKEDLQFVEKYSEKVPGSVPYMNGVKGIFIREIDDPAAMAKVDAALKYYFKSYEIYEDLDNVLEKDSITRTGFMTKECVYDGLYQKIKEDLPQFDVSASAEYCIDILDYGVNKGLCIKELQEILGVTVDETMIFGDNYNDLCMMDRATYSYAMANGQEEVKNICNYIAPPNTEAGVLQVIRKNVLGDATDKIEKMYHTLDRFCQEKGYVQSKWALDFARKMHEGQFRMESVGKNKVPYFYHPLNVACHALALGFEEDDMIAACLLHDVCEDCGVGFEELKVSDAVKEAVRLLTKPEGFKKIYTDESAYYNGVASNRIATIVKLLDRCHNVSDMSGSFCDMKMMKYLRETENYVYPLWNIASKKYPEYEGKLFLIKYHMTSVAKAITDCMKPEI